MTEAYRHKLLNWLTSMGVLALFTNLCLASFWFFNRPVGRVRTVELDGNQIGPDGWSLIDWAGPMGEMLFTVFGYGFLICALWHVFDLLQRQPARDYPATLFANYPPFVLTLAFIGILLSLLASNRFRDTVCAKNPDGSDMVFGFDTCQTFISPWLTWPFWIVMLLLVALSIGKGIVAFKSRFSRDS